MESNIKQSLIRLALLLCFILFMLAFLFDSMGLLYKYKYVQLASLHSSDTDLNHVHHMQPNKKPSVMTSEDKKKEKSINLLKKEEKESEVVRNKLNEPSNVKESNNVLNDIKQHNKKNIISKSAKVEVKPNDEEEEEEEEDDDNDE